MNLALMMAKKSLGKTKENPAVGCIIVNKNGVISSGSTSSSGRPHAEYNAIKYSKNTIINSSLYVTLEPCSHYGKTPPCVIKIVKNKIKNVYFSVSDPDPRSFNKSIKNLNKANIIVKKGILNKKIKNFYRSYFVNKKENLPFVTAKIALSKDLYSKNKKNKWITNHFSRGRVHLLRSLQDCIITSAKTVIEDNPMLNCRIKGLENRSPSRIIIDKNLKTPLNSNIAKTAFKYKTIIFHNKINISKIKKLKKMKIKLIWFPLSLNGNFILKNILKKIKSMGFFRIFIEAGLNLTTNFLKENTINDFYFFISNSNLGKNGLDNFKKNMKKYLKNKVFFNEKVNLLGDKLVSYKIK